MPGNICYEHLNQIAPWHQFSLSISSLKCLHGWKISWGMHGIGVAGGMGVQIYPSHTPLLPRIGCGCPGGPYIRTTCTTLYNGACNLRPVYFKTFLYFKRRPSVATTLIFPMKICLHFKTHLQLKAPFFMFLWLDKRP